MACSPDRVRGLPAMTGTWDPTQGPGLNGTVEDTESIPLTDMEFLGCSQFCFQN